MEETIRIKKVMQELETTMLVMTRTGMKTRLGHNQTDDDQEHPDRDKQREEKATLGTRNDQDKQQGTQEEPTKATDIQEMSDYRLSEMEPPWITDMTSEQMEHITKWIQTVAVTSPILGFTVQDDTIFTMDEMENSLTDNTVQLQC
eukprot:11687502-Heterocapsa_arctica.AAC.1